MRLFLTAGMWRVLLAALLLCAALAAAKPVEIRYELSMPEPWTHLFHVELSLDGVPRGDAAVEFRLPSWRSGRYAILDFAGGVSAFEAVDGAGRALRWTKTDKQTWRVEKPGATALRIRYKVYADRFEERTRGLNDSHGFVDGTAVFMYVQEFRQLPLVLSVRPWGAWHVTTGLEMKGDSVNVFTAPSYEVLADSPLEIGNQRDYAFTVEGKPHVLSVYGPLNCDIDTLIADVSRIVTVNARFWGSLPYRRFLFILHAIPGGSGGTEHSNSCVLTVPLDPSPGTKVCRNLLGLFSHEFFHVWNVKQFRPRGMNPYDWTGENYYREIWLAEGGTSYMHGRLMMQASFSSPRDYAAGLGAMVYDERTRAGNRLQSLSECSFDLWIRGRRGGGSRNFETDVYGKGAQVSLCLDLEIRQRSANARSFNDLLLTLYRRFPPGSAGYTVQDVETIAGELAGGSMSAFFLKYVHGVEPLPWERVLGYAGLTLDTVSGPVVPYLGVVAADGAGGTLVREVVAGSPAYRSGVNVGDQIVALNDYRVQTAQFIERVRAFSLGDTIRLALFREERLRTLPVVLDARQAPAYEVRRVPQPTPLQRAIYESWTGDTW